MTPQSCLHQIYLTHVALYRLHQVEEKVKGSHEIQRLVVDAYDAVERLRVLLEAERQAETAAGTPVKSSR